MANLSNDKVKGLLREGKKPVEIAKEFNISRQAVYYHVQKIKRKKEPKTIPSYPEKAKKNYNSLIDWRMYNEGLVKIGEFLFDFELFSDWDKELEIMNWNKRGRDYEYPNSFMLFFLRL
ncbi:MAG: winged helix-turn-helix domain-containing protein, partial [bacterium]